MNGHGALPPALSFVLVTDEAATLGTTLDHLRAQSLAGLIELVVVQPAGVPVTDLAAGLWGARTIELESIHPFADARAAGARAAAAPIVAFGETHCYPQPGWAEALLAAHEREVAAVGPAMANANPSSAVSWANLLIDYGPWVEADEPGPRHDLPGHNSSYKRALLLDYGDGLEGWLRCEYLMHEDLRAKGHVLWLEPRMRAAHLNVTLLSSWLPERFWGGRQFAATRVERWPRRRRLGFAAAAPLLPLVRGYRSVPAWRRCARSAGLPWRSAPALAAGLIASAAGELVGSLAGPGRSIERSAEIELHREDHVAPS